MERLAYRVTEWAGSTPAMVAAFIFVLVWAVGGVFRADGYDTTYQLWLNTPTTAATFLAVFMLQRAQNANTKALHLKLDELVLAVEGARDEIAGIEQAGEEAMTKAKERD